MTQTVNQNQNPAYVGIIIAWGITEIVKAITPLIILAFNKAKRYLVNVVIPAIKQYLDNEIMPAVNEQFPEYLEYANKAMPKVKELKTIWLTRYETMLDFIIDRAVDIKEVGIELWFVVTAKVKEVVKN